MRWLKWSDMAAICLVGSLVSYAPAETVFTESLGAGEQEAWKEYLLPLPREMAFRGAITVSDPSFAVGPASSRSETSRLVVDEIGEWVGEELSWNDPNASVTIRLAILDDAPVSLPARVDASELRNVPNSSQAYAIDIGEDGSILLFAFDTPGLYYAGQTFLQLLEGGRKDDGSLELPVVTIRDWPAMDERGVWNHSFFREWIPWMSSMKMNYSNMWTVRLERFTRGERNNATIDTELMEWAEVRGFRHLPQILHLNFLDRYSLFSAYPELAGIGAESMAGRYHAHKKGSLNRVPFAGHPKFVEILRNWMEDMAEQGAGEVVCWLTERPAQDGRVETKEAGQFVLEGRAFTEAWEQAKEKYPDLQIRLFLSTTETVRNYKVVHEAPETVKIVRACAIPIERVTRLPRDHYANPLLDSYAAEGRWVGSYDVPLNANGKVETPEFKLPHRSPHRIRHFVHNLLDRQYSSASGMMAWANHTRHICSMNISALAEWSWNPEGRDEAAFSRAWARRNGLDPDAVEAWTAIMGPIEWDVYDSGFPEKYAWDEAREFIEGENWPYLGEGIFRYYYTVDDFDEKLALVSQAMEMAGTIGHRSFVDETRIIQTYIEMDQALYHIARSVALGGLEDMERQAEMRSFLADLETACAANAAAIEQWREAYGDEQWHNRVHDAIASTKRLADDVTDLVRHRYLYD